MEDYHEGHRRRSLPQAAAGVERCLKTSTPSARTVIQYMPDARSARRWDSVTKRKLLQ